MASSRRFFHFLQLLIAFIVCLFRYSLQGECEEEVEEWFTAINEQIEGLIASQEFSHDLSDDQPGSGGGWALKVFAYLSCLKNIFNLILRTYIFSCSTRNVGL